MTTQFHYDLMVQRIAGVRRIALRLQLDSIEHIAYERAIPNGPVRLEVIANPWEYRFFAAVGDEALEEVGRAKTRFLSTEIAGTFTGVYAGLYARTVAGGRPAHADFDWFDYEPIEQEKEYQ